MVPKHLSPQCKDNIFIRKYFIKRREKINIPREIKLFAVHKNHGKTQSGFFSVDEEDGAKMDLEFQ